MQAEIRYCFPFAANCQGNVRENQAKKKQIFQLFELNFVFIDLAFEVRDQ